METDPNEPPDDCGPFTEEQKADQEFAKRKALRDLYILRSPEKRLAWQKNYYLRNREAILARKRERDSREKANA
jgi:hypothetical protein